jgi:hypothetical protein
MVDQEITQEILVCECYTHHLVVQHYREADKETGKVSEDGFDICVFSYGIYPSKPNIWYRLKRAFQFLKDGTLFYDSVSLTPENAKKLAKFIDSKYEQDNTRI